MIVLPHAGRVEARPAIEGASLGDSQFLSAAAGAHIWRALATGVGVLYPAEDRQGWRGHVFVLRRDYLLGRDDPHGSMAITIPAVDAASAALGAGGNNQKLLERNLSYKFKLANRPAMVILDQPLREPAFQKFTIHPAELFVALRPPLANAVDADHLAVSVEQRRRLRGPKQFSAEAAWLDAEHALGGDPPLQPVLDIQPCLITTAAQVVRHGVCYEGIALA